MDKAIESSFH